MDSWIKFSLTVNFAGLISDYDYWSEVKVEEKGLLQRSYLFQMQALLNNSSLNQLNGRQWICGQVAEIAGNKAVFWECIFVKQGSNIDTYS